MQNVLEYLEATVGRYPDKIGVRDEKTACTFEGLQDRAKQIGSYLIQKTNGRQPVVCFMEKSVEALQAFLGIVYAGDFYVLVDPSFPVERIQQIFTILNPELILTQEENLEKLKRTGFTGTITLISRIGQQIMEDLLEERRRQAVDTDPLYCIFTSGSTGVPKGVLISHRSVIDFIDQFTSVFGIDATDCIGNQAPFDFDVSVKDIYSCLKTGATLVIIPKSCFMFPNAVMDMIEENQVTTLIWAVSALCLLNRLHGLKYKAPQSIRRIMFSGEPMPVKQLNQWKSYYPDAMFVNLYGPTEITCNCTYYILDREFSGEEKIPMGQAFPNERVMLLNEDNQEIKTPGIVGEICVSGTTLALGYYNNPEMTKKAFVQNPTQKAYPELIYRTGDLACYGEDGNLYFFGRKDFQIKHMGHRIELEEIEAVLENLSMVEHACCFFDEEKNKVVACFVGNENKRAMIDAMKQKVPEYMVPNVWVQMERLPLTKNGKTNRKLLKENYLERRNHGTTNLS